GTPASPLPASADPDTPLAMHANMIVPVRAVSAPTIDGRLSRMRGSIVIVSLPGVICDGNRHHALDCSSRVVAGRLRVVQTDDGTREKSNTEVILPLSRAPRRGPSG